MPNGLYKVPEDCRAYYDCSNSRTYYRDGLATGLVFDSATRTTKHSWQSSCSIKKGMYVPFAAQFTIS